MLGGIITIQSMVIDMRFFRLVVSCAILLCFVCVPVFADDTTGSAITEPVEIFTDDNVPANITVVVNRDDNSDRITALENSLADLSNSDSSSVSKYDGLQLMSVNVSSERISASDANGFKAVVLGLLGDYETVITDYTYQSTQGYVSHSIDITPDYSWCCSCGVFALVIFCFFRLVGGFLCRQ